MSRPHPHLLEIAAWPWLSRLSRRAGRPVTLATVPAEVWDGIARQGFDYLFLMGVWERRPLGRRIALEDAGLRAAYDRALPGWTDADVVGSPYCVSVYRPDARMGGWTGLDAARAALHRRGMQLIVDFVPNHTAFDHPWVSASPERYVHGTEEDLAAAPSDFRLFPSDDTRPGIVLVQHAIRGTTSPPADDPADAPLVLPAGGPYRVFFDMAQRFAVLRPETPGYLTISNQFEQAGLAIRDGANVQDTLDDAVDAIEQDIQDNNSYGFGE